MKLLSVLILFLILGIASVAQDKLSATLYFKDGKIKKVMVNHDFESKGNPYVYGYQEGKRKPYYYRKLDSLRVEGRLYTIEKIEGKQNLMKPLEMGAVELYFVNGRSVYMRNKNSRFIRVPKGKYFEGYELFCTRAPSETPREMTLDQLRTGVSQYNKLPQGFHDKPVYYDFVRNTSKSAVLRVSFYRPELGLELKLGKRTSLYNSIGMNLFGNVTRDVRTFVNFDTSTELRQYYCTKRRLRKNKSNHNFSGPFIALSHRYFIELTEPDQSYIGLTHGWQSTQLLGGAYWGYRFGASLDVADNENVLLVSFLNLGWTF